MNVRFKSSMYEFESAIIRETLELLRVSEKKKVKLVKIIQSELCWLPRKLVQHIPVRDDRDWGRMSRGR